MADRSSSCRVTFTLHCGERRSLCGRVSSGTDTPVHPCALLELELDRVLVGSCHIRVVSGCATMVDIPSAHATCKPVDLIQRDRMDAERRGLDKLSSSRWAGCDCVRCCDLIRPCLADPDSIQQQIEKFFD